MVIVQLVKTSPQAVLNELNLVEDSAQIISFHLFSFSDSRPLESSV
jgi:hypothetical protein